MYSVSRNLHGPVSINISILLIDNDFSPSKKPARGDVVIDYGNGFSVRQVFDDWEKEPE